VGDHDEVRLFVELAAVAGGGAGAGASSALVVKLVVPLAKGTTPDQVRKYVIENSADVAKKIAASLKPKAATAGLSEGKILTLLKGPQALSCPTGDAEFEALLRRKSCSVHD